MLPRVPSRERQLSNDYSGAPAAGRSPAGADLSGLRAAPTHGARRTRSLPTPLLFWRLVLALYLATTAAVTASRIWARTSNNFLIFRTAATTLLAHQDLYAPHPGQHFDLYKYSPTFALLFLPFAALPYGAALAAWNLLNAVALCVAFRRLLAPREAALALALALPAFAVATQGSQSNALVTALIVLGFVALERGRQLPAVAAIVAGSSVKLFPAAALSFAVFHPRRRRLALVTVALGAAAVALPLVVLTPAELRQQYASWHRVEQVDSLDRGSSVMQLAHDLAGVDWPNWPMQLAGTAALLLPLALRRARWREPHFRHLFLASLLVYAVLFNHQAERASFLIASAGVGLWYATSARRTPWRTTLAVLAAFGMHSAVCLPAWLAMQADLYAAGDAPASGGA